MRELADVERDVLARLLAVEFAGAASLRIQAASILGVESGCTCGCPTITLRVDRDAAPPVHLGPVLPTELVEVARVDGIPRTVLCFIDRDGYLASLECVYYDDARPEWPPPDQCDVLLFGERDRPGPRATRRTIIASGGSDRVGLGWEFRRADGSLMWTVFREDGGAFPVFSSGRGKDPLPPDEELQEMTLEAVSDLLGNIVPAAQLHWDARNITGALLLASKDVVSWEGEEWALDCEPAPEPGASEVPTAWSEPGDPRTPYDWLRARCVGSDAHISGYQDGGLFGLRFVDVSARALPSVGTGLLRPASAMTLSRGRITSVDAAFDTTIDEDGVAGLLTEVFLRGDSGTTLLIAAEAYSREEWRLYDESIVALTDTTVADRLAWHPPRPSWRPVPRPDLPS